MGPAHEPQAPNRLHSLLLRLRAEGRDIVDLTETNPTHVGLPYPESEILAHLADRENLRYDAEPAGLLPARRAIAEYYAESEPAGIAVKAEDLILTSGTSEAYGYLFKLLCRPGDEVLLGTPCYPLLDCLAELEHVSLVKYPFRFQPQADRPWALDVTALEHSISTRTRALMVVNPNNPTGHFFTAAEARALLEIAARHDLAVVVDEVFSDYSLADEKFPRFAFYVQEMEKPPLLFTLNGFSKTLGLPQLKLGWIHIAGEESEVRGTHSRLEFIADAYLSVNSPVQNAAGPLLKHRGTLQGSILSRIRENLAVAISLFEGSETVQVVKPEGGWQLMLLCRTSLDDEALALLLLETCDTLAHPGYFFDLRHPCALVISLLPPPPLFRLGLERLLGLLNRLSNTASSNSPLSMESRL